MRYLLLFLLPALLLTSCLKDDAYTASPNDRLAFSKDTVAFDTILSGEPTKTYSFMVYNHADKALRIPSVSLQKGQDSPFRVNVDGSALVGGSGTDFEIARKDSMVVYLMANVPEKDTDLPVSYEDKLVFTTEAGTSQEVVLTASGQDVITLKERHIQADETWSARRPYRIMDSLVVDRGATLTLEPGTCLMFHSKAQLIVHGRLVVNGSASAPVTMRGDRLDYMFTRQPYDRTPGLWGGIILKEESYDNHINYADIHSSTNGLQIDSCDIGRRTLTLENSIIHNTTHHGLNLRMASAYVGNCQLTNAGGDCVHVRGGDLQMVHCTIARFYLFTGGSGGAAIDFANYDGEERLPLQRLDITNSIITGYQSDEMMGNFNKRYDDAFNYHFDHCLINTKEIKNDEHFTNCLWDTDESSSTASDAVVRDKNFTPDFDTETLTFTFMLSPRSKAVGTADATVTAATYPLDRLGTPRTIAPDMGCYQHKAEASDQ